MLKTTFNSEDVYCFVLHCPRDLFSPEEFFSKLCGKLINVYGPRTFFISNTKYKIPLNIIYFALKYYQKVEQINTNIPFWAFPMKPISEII